MHIIPMKKTICYCSQAQSRNFKIVSANFCFNKPVQHKFVAEVQVELDRQTDRGTYGEAAPFKILLRNNFKVFLWQLDPYGYYCEGNILDTGFSECIQMYLPILTCARIICRFVNMLLNNKEAIKINVNVLPGLSSQFHRFWSVWELQAERRSHYT